MVHDSVCTELGARFRVRGRVRQRAIYHVASYVFCMFGDPSVERLNLSHNCGEAITPGDCGDVLEHDRQAAQDPVVLDYLIRLVRGKLSRPRGRPKSSLSSCIS
jgi:hypothetical protein